MVTVEKLKEILAENEKFILETVSNVVPREDIVVPRTAKKACILYGVRRSGKSFILYHHFRNNVKDAAYIDFEDERLTGFTVHDFDKLKEAVYELKPHLAKTGGAFFLLDEIQIVDGWERFVRRMVERERARVFCAGSSSKIMPKAIHTSLRGRSWNVEVFPFSFREFLLSRDVDAAKVDSVFGHKKTEVKRLFHEYMRYGGFPESATLKSEFEKNKVIKEYIDAMFFKDLVEKYNIRNVPLLDALKERMFSSFATDWSLSAFYKQYRDKIPLSKDMLFAYYGYFVESMLVFEVRKLSSSSYVRMRNPAKIYLVDVSLRRSVECEDRGRILENLIFLAERRKSNEMFFYREKDECDFVVRRPDGWNVLQVTWHLENNRERELAGLVSAAKFLKLRRGTIITYEDEQTERVEGIDISVIPAWKYLLTSSEYRPDRL